MAVFLCYLFLFTRCAFFQTKKLLKKFIFSYSCCSCIIFILPSYFLYTEVMLFLIYIMQNVVFSLEKSANVQVHSSSVSHYPIKKFTPARYPIPPTS